MTGRRVCRQLRVCLVIFSLIELGLALALRMPPSHWAFRDALDAWYMDWERSIVQYEPACARYDAELTYTLRPGTCWFANREFDVELRINSLGVRDDEAALTAPEIVVLGDSFTMGWGVAQEQAFPHRLARLTGRRVLNAGVSSYGTARELEMYRRVDRKATTHLIYPPFSMQALASRTDASFMEEAAPVAAFAPGYRLGIEARDQIHGPDVAWTTSLSSVGQSQRFRDASDSPLRLSARAVWRPEGVPDDPDAELLHVGLSTGYSFSGSGDVHYRTRPESSLTSYLVDTGDIHGDAAQLGVELARRTGPLRIDAEWLGTWVNGSGRSYFFSGSYAELGWAVTGEVRQYEPKSALFTESVPLRPFSWERRAARAERPTATSAFTPGSGRRIAVTAWSPRLEWGGIAPAPGGGAAL